MDPAKSWTSDTAILRRVLIVAAVIVLALLVWEWRRVFLLAFGSILIAVGLRGLAQYAANRTPIGPKVALAISAVVVLGILGGIGWLFGSQITAQISELDSRLPEAWESVRGFLSGSVIGETVLSQVEGMSSGAPSGTLSRIGEWTMSLADAGLDVIVVLFAAAFIAVDPQPYRNGFLKLFPSGLRGKLDESLEKCAVALMKWLQGTLISMVAIALMLGPALWFLGVPAFIPLALIAALAQFVPVIGPVIATVPGVLLALTVGPETALWTLGAYVATSQVEANLLYPIIQQKELSVPPALTLFAIIAMALLFGPLGGLFAVPLTVVALILVNDFYVAELLHDQPSQLGGEGGSDER